MAKKMGEMLEVLGIEFDEIAYNPAVIVQRNTNTIVRGENIIAARVENLNSNWLDPKLYNPHIMFFSRRGNKLEPIVNAPVFYQCEDPWATWLTGKKGEPQLLFGAVKVYFDGQGTIITTQLYLAPSVQELRVDEPIAEIRGMKDVRVAQLQNGKIAVFTRPITNEAYPGRIGFTLIDSIQEIEKAATNAPLLKFSLGKDTRIGANEAFAIARPDSAGENREVVQVFCHVATTDPIKQDGNEVLDFNRGLIHYAGYQFDLDPNHPFDNVVTLHKVVDRLNFPVNNSFSKGSRFDNVVFPGGTGGPEQTQYYCGVEDARIGVIDLV